MEISLSDFRKKCTNNGLPEYALPTPAPVHIDAKPRSRGRMTFQAAPSADMVEKHAPAPGSEPRSAAYAALQPKLGTIHVEFAKEGKIGVKQMRDFVHAVQKNEFATGVLVYPEAMTTAALKIVPAVLPIVIETFAEQDLIVNITKHELVPKHILLSATEKKALLERYRLKESQLPRIQATDPVARYLGLKRGQVVKIIRRSETAGRYASYRWTI